MHISTCCGIVQWCSAKNKCGYTYAASKVDEAPLDTKIEAPKVVGGCGEGVFPPHWRGVWKEKFFLLVFGFQNGKFLVHSWSYFYS